MSGLETCSCPSCVAHQIVRIMVKGSDSTFVTYFGRSELTRINRGTMASIGPLPISVAPSSNGRSPAGSINKRGHGVETRVIMQRIAVVERTGDDLRHRADTPSSCEVSMELESIDPTSATLLDRVGLSPNDEVAWARFVGVYGSKIRGWCRRWGLQAADTEDVTQDVLLAAGPEARNVPLRPVPQFPRLAANGHSERPGRLPRGSEASVFRQRRRRCTRAAPERPGA